MKRNPYVYINPKAILPRIFHQQSIKTLMSSSSSTPNTTVVRAFPLVTIVCRPGVNPLIWPACWIYRDGSPVDRAIWDRCCFGWMPWKYLVAKMEHGVWVYLYPKYIEDMRTFYANRDPPSDESTEEIKTARGA
jgi:hypothetical protein